MDKDDAIMNIPFVIRSMNQEVPNQINSIGVGFHYTQKKILRNKKLQLNIVEQTIDPEINRVSLRPSSNIFLFKCSCVQYYRLCIESYLSEVGHSVFHIKEYCVSWPRGLIGKNKMEMKHHMIKLTGMMYYKPRKQNQNEMFYPNI